MVKLFTSCMHINIYQNVYLTSLSAGMELEGLMESSNNPSEAAVSKARLQVCGTSGPVGNASGSTPPPALGAWLRGHLPPNAAAALDRLSSPPPLACINLVSTILQTLSHSSKSECSKLAFFHFKRQIVWTI